MRKKLKRVVVGIDATNLRSGGGVTHLIELLSAVEPSEHGIGQIIVWGGQKTLSLIPDASWLQKSSPALLNRGLLYRVCWQRFFLSRAARNAKCDVLFIPGGSYLGGFKPVIVMSRNLLPFDWAELRRYGLSLMVIKLFLLRFTQTLSFRESEGIIFLTKYAQKIVLGVTGRFLGKVAIIPHGLSVRFLMQPREQRSLESYNSKNPYRLLYVSSIDHYKHQWCVVEAVYNLRLQGLPLKLDLIGQAYLPALRRLMVAINKFDPQNSWVSYHGVVPYKKLHNFYTRADLGIFASSCENMPNILLETMASGLPVACSNRGPMPEVLGDAGLYFNPEDISDIEKTLRFYIDNPETRSKKAWASFFEAKRFIWKDCAHSTFSFIVEIANNDHRL